MKRFTVTTCWHYCSAENYFDTLEEAQEFMANNARKLAEEHHTGEASIRSADMSITSTNWGVYIDENWGFF